MGKFILLLSFALGATSSLGDDHVDVDKVQRVIGPGRRLLGKEEAPAASTSSTQIGDESFLLIDVERTFDPGPVDRLVDPKLASGQFCTYILREAPKGAVTLKASDRRLNITCVEAVPTGNGSFDTRYNVDDPQLAAVVCHNEGGRRLLTVHECGTALGVYVTLVAIPVGGTVTAMDSCGTGKSLAHARAIRARVPAAVGPVLPGGYREMSRGDGLDCDMPTPTSALTPWQAPTPERDGGSDSGSRKQ